MYKNFFQTRRFILSFGLVVAACISTLDATHACGGHNAKCGGTMGFGPCCGDLGLSCEMEGAAVPYYGRCKWPFAKETNLRR